MDPQRPRQVPAEIWGIVAEFLAWDDGIESLPALSRASREVYQGTLPVLYETVWLDNEAAFTRCMGSTNLSGFRYTKYVPIPFSWTLLISQRRFLFVNDLTLPLLRMHQRYQAVLNQTTPAPSFSDIFPRLIFLGHTKPDPSGHQFPATHPRAKCSPLHITLFKTLGIDTLLRISTPAMLGQDVATSFFGGYFYPGPYYDRPEIISIRDIVGLTVEPGAELWPSREVKMEQVQPTRESPTFELEVADGLGEETLAVVMGYLKAYAESKEVIMRGRWVMVNVSFGVEELKKLTELVSRGASFRSHSW